MQRQRDRQMELSNRAHVQFQEESIETREKGKYGVEASREMARIQSEDEKAIENDRIDKKRARESLESQIARQQSEAKQNQIKDHRADAYKDQVNSLSLL